MHKRGNLCFPFYFYKITFKQTNMIIIVGNELNEENIFKRITSLDIFSRYCKNFTSITKNFKSPFRKDKHPSCRIGYVGGDLLYKDFGTGEHYRAIQFVQKVFNISYIEALQKINEDFNLGLTFYYEEKPTKFKQIHSINNYDDVIIDYEKQIYEIKIKRKEFSKEDLMYWNSYNITLNTLNLYNVYPISYFWLKGNLYKAKQNAYSYNFYPITNNIIARKIYQPFDKIKWITNCGNIIQGYQSLYENSDYIIITKSLKDVMTLKEMGYVSIATSTETKFFDDRISNKLKERYKKIILFFDNDETGKKFTESVSQNYNIQDFIFIPEECEVKDISDFVKTYTFDEGKKLLKNLLHGKVEKCIYPL